MTLAGNRPILQQAQEMFVFAGENRDVGNRLTSCYYLGGLLGE